MHCTSINITIFSVNWIYSQSKILFSSLTLYTHPHIYILHPYSTQPPRRPYKAMSPISALFSSSACHHHRLPLPPPPPPPFTNNITIFPHVLKNIYQETFFFSKSVFIFLSVQYTFLSLVIRMNGRKVFLKFVFVRAALLLCFHDGKCTL